MPESPAPAFVKIESTSLNAPHVAILPTLQWNDPGDFTAGTFDTHEGGSIAADDMVNDLVNVLAALYTGDYDFISYTIFTQSSPSADPVPRFSEALSQSGVTVSATWQKAVQLTFTWRTTLFGIAKIVALDAISGNNFDRITTLTPMSAEALIDAEFTSVARGWSGRDGGRPATFLQISKTINEKLRRQYHMT